MKTTPISSADRAPVNPDEGRSAGTDRLARAKAVASGQTPQETPIDQQVEKIQNSIKRIKMKTQRSPDRYSPPTKQEVAAFEADVNPPETEEPVKTDLLDKNEPADKATEATQPLSTQFAALAKQKRALQLKEQALLAKEQELASKGTDNTSLQEYKARLKANALSVLREEGVSYDQLTEELLASTPDNGAAYSEIKAELKALKEGLENQNKSLTDRDAAAEQQVLSQMKVEAERLVAEGEDFAMVREAGYVPKAIELIHKTWKTQGEVLDVTEALALIENELLEESLKFARIKKVQSRLNPVPALEKQPAVQQDGPNRKTMRTLTNRDGASSPSSARERAIAAFYGRK